MKNSNELELILKDFYTISGFNMSLFDINFELFMSYPKHKSPFCHEIEKHEHALHHCQKCDYDAFSHVKKTNKTHIYRCYYGLYEAVAPLYDGQILIGYLMMGQTLNKSQQDLDYIYHQASPYIQDSQKLKKIINQLTSHSYEQIIAHISIMQICASYISLTNRLESAQIDLAKELKVYIDTHFSSALTIDDLCQLFYCSRATLTKTFRHKYHITIHEYITAKRMEHALTLLQSTHLCIKEIATQCGYHDQNYFSKAFRKHFQQSPSSFQKK